MNTAPTPDTDQKPQETQALQDELIRAVAIVLGVALELSSTRQDALEETP